MSNKKIPLFLMVGLLAISFILPAMASSKPSYALGRDAIPGWTLWKEDSPTIPWNYSATNLNVWYQIWMNNQTDDGWENASAAMLIILIEFPSNIDLNKEYFGISLWDLLEIFLTATGSNVTTKTIPGFDHADAFKKGAVWGGVGNKGNIVVVVFGVGTDVPPANVFEGAGKDLADSSATYGNIMSLMIAQGVSFASGIPGFTIVPIFISMVIILALYYLIRKDQLNLLKTN